MDYLKRSEAASDADVIAFLFYIHKNAVHHGITKNIGDWKHDSFNLILSNKQTSLSREGVIGFFDTFENFIAFHKQPVNLKDFDIDT